MKGQYNFLTLLITLILLTTVVTSETMTNGLTNYYEQSKLENINEYYSNIDTTQMSAIDLETKKEITQTLWSKFDLLKYTITNEKEYQKNDYGYIEYSLSYSIEGFNSNGVKETINNNDNYIASMHLIDGKWKVINVMQQDIFDANFENFYIQTQKDLITDINKESVERYTPLESNNFADIPNSKTDVTKFSNIKIIFIIISLIVVIGLIFIFTKKKK